MSNEIEKSEVNEKTVKAFKSAVVAATPSLVTLKEKAIARRIPDEIFEEVFRTVFKGKLTQAKHILNNQFDKVDSSYVEGQVEAISTLKPASDVIVDAVERSAPILMIGDADPDGCFVQSVGMEFSRITGGDFDDEGMTIGTRDYNPMSHGFSLKQIENWMVSKNIRDDDFFVVLVADLGTNQRDEQIEFLNRFSQAVLVIADHHRPDPDAVVLNSEDRTYFVSPHVKGSFALGAQAGGGVSGGYLTYAILKESLMTLHQKGALDLSPSALNGHLKTLKDMGKAANLLDGVGDILIKPLHEGDIKKALDVAKITRNGRSVGKWLGASQIANIKSLSDLVGAHGVDDLISIRADLIKQNHVAYALFKAIPPILRKEDGLDVSKFTAMQMESNVAESTIGTNYVEKIRPYLYSFKYENQLDSKIKGGWLSLAESTLARIGTLEKAIVEKIRDYELVNEISDDFISLTQSASPAVNNAFTTKQLSKAYHGLAKPVTLTVAKITKSEVIMSYRSKVSMSEALHNTSETLLGIKTSMRGHDGVGGLTLDVPNGMAPQDALSMFVRQMNLEIKKIKDEQPAPKSIQVVPIHLSLLKEMLQKMRVHLVQDAAPMLMMKVSQNTTFEDKYSLEKKSVSKIIEGREWGTTVESLDFGATSSLILPNQALKAVANDDFQGALGISLMPNGSYIANDFFTGEQLKFLNVPKLSTPLQKDKASLSKYYKDHFKDAPLPILPILRQDAIDALKFTRNPEQVFEQTEAMMLGVLNATKADSYVTLDVEADGASNAECINVGLTIGRKSKAGKVLSQHDFDRVMKHKPEGVKNFRQVDDGFVINEKIDISLVSIVINRDGDRSQQISLKTQNLTNMDQDMIDELGMSSKEAQDKLNLVFDGLGEFVIQAHNLPYDNNIMQVNFPEIHNRMRTAIHLDSAPLSKNHHISYFNMQVFGLAGKEFFVSNHEGYNLNTLIQSGNDFEFPSVKGDAMLVCRGEKLRLLDLKSRVMTELPEGRDEVARNIPVKIGPMRYPEYNIQKMMGQATIHDIIISQTSNPTNFIEFNNFGTDVQLSDKAWTLFQKNYSYENSPAQNLAKFNVLPDLPKTASDLQYQDGETVPDFLSDVKPSKKSKNKVITFTYAGADVLNAVMKANALNFAKANPENAEKFALGWAYDLVLNHYEPTTKDLSDDFLQGISDATGVAPSVVGKIYGDLYGYKKERGIESFRESETHNNFGLEGDAFQELNVFMHMLYRQLKNPYLINEDGLTSSVNPHDVAVNELRRQAAESTMRQIVRDTLGVIISEDDVNSYSAKQLDNFDKSGISMAIDRSGVTKMKSKTLWKGDTVSVTLPNFDANHFRSMPEESKKEIEEALKLAVSTVYLANSRSSSKISGDDDSMNLIESVILSNDVLDNLKYVDGFLGGIVASTKDDTIKKIMKSAISAIARGEDFKVPANIDLSPEDVDVVHDAIKSMVSRLDEQQRFKSELPLDVVDEAMSMAKLEFDIMRNIEPGQYDAADAKNIPGYEDVPRGHKSSITARVKAMNSILPEHLEAAPTLLKSLVSKKEDPLLCLVNSDMSSHLIKSKVGSAITGLELSDPDLEKTNDDVSLTRARK